MHAINNVLKWTLYSTAIVGLSVLGGAFAFWLMIEVLAFLIGVSE